MNILLLRATQQPDEIMVVSLLLKVFRFLVYAENLSIKIWKGNLNFLMILGKNGEATLEIQSFLITLNNGCIILWPYYSVNFFQIENIHHKVFAEWFIADMNMLWHSWHCGPKAPWSWFGSPLHSGLLVKCPLKIYHHAIPQWVNYIKTKCFNSDNLCIL